MNPRMNLIAATASIITAAIVISTSTIIQAIRITTYLAKERVGKEYQVFHKANSQPKIRPRLAYLQVISCNLIIFT